MSQTVPRHSERNPRTGRYVHVRAPGDAASTTVKPPAPATPAGGGLKTTVPARRTPQTPRWGKRVQWTVSVLVAATIGTASFFVGGFQYRAAVELRVTDAGVPETVLGDLRRELLDQAWQALSASTDRWRVELDVPARALRVTVTSPRSGQVSTSVVQVATDCVEHIRKVVEHARTQPGPDEVVLAEFRQRLADEHRVLNGDLRRIESTLPGEDCALVDAELHTRLTARRADYAQNRERVRQAEAQLAAIRAAPPPERATVDPEVREQAIRADAEVQQDLKALRVQLAEARYQLLGVLEAASPMLDALAASAKDLEELCSGDQVGSAEAELRRSVERIGQSTADYGALLTEFAQVWAREGDGLRTLADDPRRANVLHAQATLYDLLSGFIFQSTVPLTSIRDQVRAVSTAPGTPAHRHELASSLARGLHALQSAHHQFEFAAGDVKPSNNFRLDAALKSAKGLYHRSCGRLEQIEERLSRQALADLRATRARRIAVLEQEIGQLRPTLDASVEAMMATHEQADRNAPTLQGYRESRAVAGVYEERILDVERKLARIDTQLNDRAAKRMEVINTDHLLIVPLRAGRWPVNLPAKLFQGTLAFAAVLALLIGLQLWLSPRVV